MRGTAVAKDFRIDEEMRSWANVRVPMVNIDAEHEKFIDHHLATGKTMLDWNAAWRTWMRNAMTFRGAVHYTQDEMQLKKMMLEYTAQGFRRAYQHENSNMYRFEFDRWKAAREGAKPRDMGGMKELLEKLKVSA